MRTPDAIKAELEAHAADTARGAKVYQDRIDELKTVVSPNADQKAELAANEEDLDRFVQRADATATALEHELSTAE